MLTESMSYLIAVVRDNDKEDVSKALLKLGVLHMVDVTEVKEDWRGKLAELPVASTRGRIEELRKKIESMVRAIGVSFKLKDNVDLKSYKIENIEEKEEKINKIFEEIDEKREKQRLIQQEIMKYEDIKRNISGTGLDISSLHLVKEYSFIEIKYGDIPLESYDSLEKELKSYPNVVIPLKKEDNNVSALIIFMKRNSAEIEEILEKSGWNEKAVPPELKNYDYGLLKNIDEKIIELRRQQKEIADEADRVVFDHIDELERYWTELRIAELIYKIESYFKRTSTTVIFSGWVPTGKKEIIEKTILDVTKGKCYIQWLSADEVEKIEHRKVKVPVSLKNPRVFAPFQMLVTNYGIPEYRTVDPTPFVVFIYLIMFGLMFADVGQGLIIAVTGLIGSLVYKRHGKENIINLFKLIFWCGLTATFSGFLFGSVFGLPLVKPLWFNYHGIVLGHGSGNSYIKNIFDIIKISVIFGISVIELGIVFNWINLIIKRDWINLIFTKSGILGAWIFNGGIYISLYMVKHGYKEMPPMQQLLFLAIIPAVLIGFKKPVERIVERIEIKTTEKIAEGKKFNISISGLMNFGMEWAVELLEVFSGYLSNTLSFMRVAGFGIAHVSLMVAFYQLAEMASGGEGYNLFGILVIIFGNLLVIVLEGLSVGIQSLRLNYYEFFTKFFRGSGILYRPIKLEA